MIAATAAIKINQVEPVDDELANLEVCSERIHKATDADVIEHNKQILATDKTCKEWVKSHAHHEEVCKYCKEGVTPSDKWKFYNGVWYKWWDGRWHYYGPSRHGNGGAWKWYNGYWHYNGYVFKYEGDKWYRFYGGKWQYYDKEVHQDPKPPMTKPYCVDVYKLVEHGLPDGLALHKVPRCRVGDDIYMWEGEKKCEIVGGRKAFMSFQKCKVGTLHKWQKVRRCTKAVQIQAEQVDYTTGEGLKKVWIPGKNVTITSPPVKVAVAGANVTAPVKALEKEA